MEFENLFVGTDLSVLYLARTSSCLQFFCHFDHFVILSAGSGRNLSLVLLIGPHN